MVDEMLVNEHTHFEFTKLGKGQTSVNYVKLPEPNFIVGGELPDYSSAHFNILSANFDRYFINHEYHYTVALAPEINTVYVAV